MTTLAIFSLIALCTTLALWSLERAVFTAKYYMTPRTAKTMLVPVGDRWVTITTTGEQACAQVGEQNKLVRLAKREAVR